MKNILFTIAVAFIIACNQNSKIKKMENVVSQGNVKLSGNQVWKKLVAFDGTEKFVPDLIEKVELKGNGLGAIRNIHLKGGGLIVEKMTELDPENQILKFVILSTPMQVSNYEGIYKVIDETKNSCKVIFESSYQVLSDDKDAIKKMIKEFQKTFIFNLDK